MTLAHRVLTRFRVRQTALVPPPRNLATYLERVAKALEKNAERLKAIYQHFERVREDTTSFSYVMRNVEPDADDLRIVADQAARVAERFENVYQSIRYDKSINSAIKRINDTLEDNRWLARVHEGHADQDIEKAAEDTGFPADLVTMYQEAIRLAKGVVDMLKETVKKLTATSNIENPQPEKIEKLWHASVHARELSEHGFKESRPEGGLGLGGSVEDKAGNDAISFTYDPKYAFEIARWFKEMAMVAHGHIKPSHILAWADAEGIADETLSLFKGLHGSSSSWSSMDLFSKGIHQLVREGGRWRIIFEKFDPKQDKVVTTEGDPDTIFKSKEDIYALYYAFLNAGHNKEHRENPTGMRTSDLLANLEHVDPRDIGVIEAEVDMTDPDVLSKPGEREYRVPPRAIKRIVRFL